jgi:hypothetical protein
MAKLGAGARMDLFPALIKKDSWCVVIQISDSALSEALTGG